MGVFFLLNADHDVVFFVGSSSYLGQRLGKKKVCVCDFPHHVTTGRGLSLHSPTENDWRNAARLNGHGHANGRHRIFLDDFCFRFVR